MLLAVLERGAVLGHGALGPVLGGGSVLGLAAGRIRNAVHERHGRIMLYVCLVMVVFFCLLI